MLEFDRKICCAIFSCLSGWEIRKNHLKSFEKLAGALSISVRMAVVFLTSWIGAGAAAWQFAYTTLRLSDDVKDDANDDAKDEARHPVLPKALRCGAESARLFR